MTVTASAYCVCYVASRSLGFVLPNLSHWERFRDFFVQKRIERFHALLGEIPNAAVSDTCDANVRIGEFRAVALRMRGAMMAQPYFLAFRVSELALIRKTVADFLACLNDAVPDLERLSRIRRSLERSLGAIETKWPNADVWGRLQRSIDYYCRDLALGTPLEIDEAIENVLGPKLPGE